MQEEIKRVYATITLPIDIYKNGEMKIIYEEMDVEMETPDLDLDINTNTLREEIQERINENDNENIKIFKKDYLLKKNKNRLNSTFRKMMKRNTLTKKNYI